MSEQDLPTSESDTIRAGAPPQFPGALTDAYRAGPPPAAVAPGRTKSPTRFVVPLVLLLAMMPGSASLAQNASSTDGHAAKFVDVNGARTRYYDVGSGDVCGHVAGKALLPRHVHDACAARRNVI